MTVNLIAAIGRNGEVGRDGGLPWHRPDDLAWFKRTTMGGAVVVGRRTYATMPELPGREAFCFAREDEPRAFLGSIARLYPRRPTIWIAGGAHTWRVFAPYVDGLKLISVIDYEADDPARHVYFPFDAYGMDWRGARG